jgi:hypothetical protein
MPRQQSDGRSAYLLPLRFDGEPVTDSTYTLPLPADFRPWEEAVAAYLAEIEYLERRLQERLDPLGYRIVVERRAA